MFRRNALLAQVSAAGRGLALCDAVGRGDATGAGLLAGVAIAAQFADLGGAAPAWVHLLPLGEIKTLDGRAFTNTDAKAVVAASTAAGRDLPIDYDHAIDLIKERGGSAPAAGWIKKLDVRAPTATEPGGIWGEVEWTDRGKAAVAAKEWRFISPVFQFDKKTGAVVRILRAALTNDPAIAELRAVAHQVNPELAMNKELIALLARIFGLDLDKVTAMAAAEQQAEITRAAVAYRPPSAETAAALAVANATAPIAKALGLAEGAKADEVAAAVAAALKNPDPAKFVPIANVTELTARLAALETATKTKEATAEVDAAVAAGKLIPGQRDWGLAYATRDLAGFKGFIAKQPAILAGGRIVEGTPTGDANSLSPEEKAICRNLGLGEEAFLKTKKESLAQERA